MPDKESVITHLQIIHIWAKFARERDLQFFTPKHLENITQWSDDALELLKEQKGLMLALEQRNAVNGFLNAEVERLNGLLKEQEAVEPFHRCIGKEFSLIEDSHFDYCPYCGKPITWEKQEGR